MIPLHEILFLAAALLAADETANQPCAPQRLEAETLRAFPAADADQGAAADGRHFYAIDNAAIAKHDRATGALLLRWSGESAGLIRHLNSCFHEAARLYCANSNYPETPMASSAEIFDASTLAPIGSHSFGLTEEGSLTWFDKTPDGWIAGFSHYGKPGGLPYKDNRYSSVVEFDSGWRRVGGWLIPSALLERMAPYGASGGAIGPDGYLYLLGHDLPEMYVLAKPAMGPELIHVATVGVEAEGQAFSWAPGNERLVFAVDRRGVEKRVLEIRIPPVAESCVGAFIRHFDRKR